MKYLKYSTKTLIIGLLFASSSIVIAATDTKTIDIIVTQGAYVNLTGSAVSGNAKVITMDSVKTRNATVLGTLGIESNAAALAETDVNC
jgi:hypothetical protein